VVTNGFTFYGLVLIGISFSKEKDLLMTKMLLSHKTDDMNKNEQFRSQSYFSSAWRFNEF
jgi:tartrate dehydratase alpha subunit/fumarate hydratase class I-like protein